MDNKKGGKKSSGELSNGERNNEERNSMGRNSMERNNREGKINIEKFALKAPKNKGRKKNINNWVNQRSKNTRNLKEEYCKIVENFSSHKLPMNHKV